MAYTTINKSTEHFNTVLWTGNSGTQSITGVGFQPDFFWGKVRADNNNTGENGHILTDVVRGVTKYLQSNNNNAQATASNTITSFDSDGFSLGNKAELNSNSNTYVGWNWKAGNSAGSTNNDGSVTSTVSANTTAGFSICKFDFPSSGNFTFGHGLGVAPRMFILKGYTATANWQVYNESLGNTWNTQLNYSSSSSDGANWWGSTSPTSTVCTVGSDLIESGQTAIAYCFAEKTGFSKFGKYTGNGNADGTFVYTGFRPGFVMIKKTNGSENWSMYDTKRNINGTSNTLPLVAEDAGEESGFTGKNMDILSNGLKMKTSNGELNGSGDTYIFMAFAEAPLVGSNNVPCTAR